jgi:hypothetical protein
MGMTDSEFFFYHTFNNFVYNRKKLLIGGCFVLIGVMTYFGTKISALTEKEAYFKDDHYV